MYSFVGQFLIYMPVSYNFPPAPKNWIPKRDILKPGLFQNWRNIWASYTQEHFLKCYLISPGLILVCNSCQVFSTICRNGDARCNENSHDKVLLTVERIFFPYVITDTINRYFLFFFLQSLIENRERQSVAFRCDCRCACYTGILRNWTL